MKKSFLVANEKLKLSKNQKGISMVSMVIMIIVILILAGIIFSSSNDSIDNTGRGIFIRELGLVQQAAAEKRLDNQIYGSSEEQTNKGFYKTKVKNPPVNFVSFSEEEIYGYVIDLAYTHVEDADRGHDYPRFAVNMESNIVEFGVDDVYIYDAEGKVFYVKGYGTDDSIYYSAEETKFGPEIISVNKTISADKKSATITVVVQKHNMGDLEVTIGGEKANSIAVTPEGDVETFEIKVYENKTYLIIAKEEDAGIATSTIEVDELDVKTFIISYDANGGMNAPASQQKTENVIMRITNQVPTKPGSTFIGWNENPSAQIATYMPGGEFVLDKETTLFAIWKLGEERTYSVIYNANGGTNAPATVEDISGDYIVTSEIPTRESYGFMGWSEDAKSKTPTYVAGDKITLTKNLILYAIWEKGTYTVTVSTNPEGAGTVTGNTTKSAGADVYISTAPNPGYTFKNWTVKAGNVNLRNTTAQATSFTMPSENVEIVANYEAGQLTVRYNANKGVDAPAPQSYEYGQEIEISSKVPTRAGYDFVGWALTADAGAPEYFSGDKFTVKENVVFYAVWNTHLETYTFKFDMNGGYGNKAGEIGKFVEQVKTQGGIITIPVGGEDEPYRLDWTFKGWSLAPDSDDIALRPGDIYRKDADIEVFAVWKDEKAPTLSMTTKQEEGSRDVTMVATVHDEGLIAGYAWTMTNTLPTAWEVDGVGTKDLVSEKIITEKGKNYFWVKDVAGNYSVQHIMAYQITYDANEGVNAPEKQFQAENTDLVLTTEKPKRERYTFLGWSAAANPGNMGTDVQFPAGSKLNLNSDTTLKAVWGESFFKLSAKTGVTQIDGEDVVITVTKSAYTGNITVSSANPEIATVKIENDIITITPGTKIGDVEITAVEDREGSTETILITVKRGIRKLTLDKYEHTFTYGDSSTKIGFTYNGKETGLSTRSSNSNIATATASGKTLTITPKNYGTAVITLILAQDDQYLEKTADVQISVVKKVLTVLPDSGQKKVYDATPSTPTLKYTYSGTGYGETPGFSGGLTREIGSDVGKYEIKIGDLALANNGSFLASNYTLALSSTKVYFEITPKRITVPTPITPQKYNGQLRYGIAEGTDYTRGGEYAKTNAGTYTAIASLNDTKNFVWDDNGSTTARNLRWEITRLDLTDKTQGEITIDPVASKVYTGNQIMPVPVVRFNGVSLVNGQDFTLSYSNNINVGTATITITGKGNYKGTLTTTFQITKADMLVDISGFTGTFDNQNHSITVKPTWPSSGYAIYYSTTQLTSANYKTAGSTTNPQFKNVGTTTVYFYITQSNFKDYAGSAVVKINQKNIGTNLTISGVVNKKYTGSAITQNITVKDNDQNRTLTEGTDYTVSYSNNINLGTATVTVTGKGNFNGSKSATFTILGETISIAKSTESLVTTLTVTMSKEIPVTTLQYKIDGGAWTNYTGAITISKDCTVYGRSVHNGNVIGSNQITITNICEHEYTTVTCTTDSRCKFCNILKQSALGHDYSEANTSSSYLAQAATCTTKPRNYYKCIRCTSYDKSRTFEYGSALGHNYTSQTVTSTYLRSSATCLNAATYYYKCSRCTAKGSNYYSYGSALGHSFTVKNTSSTYFKSSATCVIGTTYYFKCSRCTAKGSNTFALDDALGHSFTVKEPSSAYVASPPTCTERPKFYFKCSRCTAKGSNTYFNGDPNGHSWGSWTTTKAANCVETGTSKRTCTACGKVESKTLAVNSSNHKGNISATVTKKATCTTAGTTQYKCLACGVITSTKSTPAAYGHTWIPATCTDWEFCDNMGCGMTRGAPKGHSYSQTTVTKATCKSGGTVKNTCTKCGYSYNSSTGKDSSNHVGQLLETRTPASCVRSGSRVYSCESCGAVVRTVTLAATGHTWGSWSTTKAATCVEGGTRQRKCTKCSSTQSEGTARNSSNHTGRVYNKTYTQPTCTTAGSVREYCGSCNAWIGTLSRAALGHNYAAATCSKPKTCTRCGATTGSKLSHSYGSWSTTKSATCTGYGSKKRSCTMCGSSQYQSISPLGHSYNWLGKCRRCGAKK